MDLTHYRLTRRMQRIFGERERPNCLYRLCMMSVMLCLQMHGIYVLGGAYGGFFCGES